MVGFLSIDGGGTRGPREGDAGSRVPGWSGILSDQHLSHPRVREKMTKSG